MSYRIEWDPVALRQFAEQWGLLDWPHQREVMQALNRTDALLMGSPMLVGESRLIAELRVLIEPPVTLRYFVHKSLNMVRIIQAHAFWKAD